MKVDAVMFLVLLFLLASWAAFNEELSKFFKNMFSSRSRNTRQVYIQMYNGALKETTATLSQSGWAVKWGYGDTTCVILRPDGKVISPDGMVKSWLPKRGWIAGDFD